MKLNNTKPLDTDKENEASHIILQQYLSIIVHMGGV